MKKELQDQLKKYSAAAAAVVATGSAADAQIVYNQVNSTINGPAGIDTIDINTDGNYDLAIVVYSSNSSNGIVLGLPLNSQGHAMAGSTPSAYNYPFKLNSGVSVKTQQFLTPDYGGTFAYFASGSSPYNEFWNGGVTDGYLGLKLIDGANTFYGWVRMDISNNVNQVVIKDMAYNSNPDGDINTGQKTLNLEHYSTIADGVWISEKRLFADIPVGFVSGNISIIDMSGKTIHQITLTEKRSEFDVNTLPDGTYILSLQLDGNTFNKQVVIK